MHVVSLALLGEVSKLTTCIALFQSLVLLLLEGSGLVRLVVVPFVLATRELLNQIGADPIGRELATSTCQIQVLWNFPPPGSVVDTASYSIASKIPRSPTWETENPTPRNPWHSSVHRLHLLWREQGNNITPALA